MNTSLFKRISVLFVLAIGICLLAGCMAKEGSQSENGSSPAARESMTPFPSGSSSEGPLPDSIRETENQRFSSLRISELMPSNQTFLPDEMGRHLDWVEIVNAGDQDLNLSLCSLSVDENSPSLYTFPDLTLHAGDRTIVFCNESVSDGSSGIAGIPMDRAGGSLCLRSPDGTLVDAVSYEDVPKNASVCYETGKSDDHSPFLTYFATPGFVNTMEGYEEYLRQYEKTGSLILSEVSAHNRSFATAKGAYYDWVELKNISDSLVLLSEYYLSDDENDLQKYNLPNKTLKPGETFVVFCSGNENLTTAVDFHAPFSIGGEEYLVLTKSDGSVSDEVFVHDIPVNGSMGRMDGEYGFWYFSSPTPGKTNAEGYREQSEKPAASLKEGVYSGLEPLTVTLAGNGDIYYTLDGSAPDENSALYTEPFTLTQTTILRAVCIEPGKMISAPASFSYIINEGDTLPVTSLVCNPQEMDTIYNSTRAQNARCDAQVSFFDTNGDGFTAGCSVELHGARSRSTFKKKSFELKFLSCYDGDVEYDLFQDGNITTFHSLLLRGGSSEKIETVKDCFASKLTYDVSPELYPQDVRYTVLYINGEYYGIYAWREAYSEEYFENHLEDVDADDVSLLRAPLDGTNELKLLVDYAMQHGMTHEDNYEVVASTLDLASLARWFALESFFNNQDINGNIRYVKTSPEGKWQLILYDLDYCCLDNHPDWETTLSSYQMGDTLVRRLLTNENFRRILLQECVTMVNNGLTTEHILEVYDELLLPLDDATVLKDCVRWNEFFNNWTGYTKGMRENLSEPRMKEWLNGLMKLTWSTTEQMHELFPDYF